MEFIDLDAMTSAEIVKSLFGGDLDRVSQHKVHVRGCRFGDFLVELDLQLLHEGDPTNPLRQLAGELGAALIPMEITCPPIRFDEAHVIDALREELRQAGAQGTLTSPFYALGAQLNPELPSHESAYLLSVLRSFVLLRDWLRDEIQVDTSRRLSFFASAFPGDWCDMILDPRYAPDMAGLTRGYLDHNPTRNRELDMLPFLAFLDEKRIRSAVAGQKVHKRPTYHYRLPNALIDSPDWSLALEWERWLAVEQLAERPELIEKYAALWRENHARLIPHDWTPTSRELRGQL
ncbi:hypothetical protein EOI86_06385 [Hwanghaeella grinnelliae]|uniref:Amidoligase enzyme n=1 Tax=Hwanghaeella grinnelliae TaxID=2500179 RepID=A0A437QWI9_9PROT|nr:hypothetical protein EOI86_06385 [Hwanghaeella grinnelliae]